MNLERLAFILRHPLCTIEQHRVKEIKCFHKFGKNEQETYYVIRCDLPACGLFAIYMYVLDHLAYAEDHGYIPVLDSQRYEWLYQEDKAVCGIKDPWQYYFEPFEKTWRSCLFDKNVIWAPIRFLRYKGIYYYKEKEANVLPTKERIAELNHLVSKYIHFRPEIQKELDEKVEELRKYRRVLGVHVRGTDMYSAGKQHPVPTGETKDFTKIDAILKEHNLEGIFLCTDTESTIHLFQEKYGDRLLYTASVRQRDDSQTGVHVDKSLGKQRKNHKYLLGKEVLTDMFLLAHCDVLLCGPSNVGFVAMIYNCNAYDKIYYCV